MSVADAVLAARQAVVAARKQVEEATQAALAALCADLKERRERRGMTQQDVADSIGLSRAQIANIEAGRGVSADALVAYAAAVDAALTLTEDRHV